MQAARATPLLIALALLCSAAVHADDSKKGKASVRAQTEKRKPAPRPPAKSVSKQVVKDGEAEARLIAIYKLAGQAKGREALALAERLVKDHPNVQLAQLV